MRRDAFTLVELLLAVALGAMVAAILAAILHGLVRSDRAQTRHLAGPVAARAALLRMAREVSCAFAPPGTGNADPDGAPLSLSRSVAGEPGEAELRLAFYLPIPSRAPQLPGFYGVERVTYEVRPVPGGGAGRELLRMSVPCSGPRTNDVRKTTLLRGNFKLSVRAGGDAGTDDPSDGIWPPESATAAGAGAALPESLRFSILLPGDETVETETLLHCSQPLE